MVWFPFIFSSQRSHLSRTRTAKCTLSSHSEGFSPCFISESALGVFQFFEPGFLARGQRSLEEAEERKGLERGSVFVRACGNGSAQHLSIRPQGARLGGVGLLFPCPAQPPVTTQCLRLLDVARSHVVYSTAVAALKAQDGLSAA